MRALPHRYVISAIAGPDGEVALTGPASSTARLASACGIRWSRRSLVA